MTGALCELEEILGRSLLSLSRPEPNRIFLELDGEKALAKAAGALAESGARLMTVTCVESPAFFELLHHFDSDGDVITLRTRVWKPLAVFPSVAGMIPAAELIEHEITELYGLAFEGNPRQGNMILAESQKELRPLRYTAGPIETRIDGNVANIVEHGSTTAPSKRVMKARAGMGMPENPSLCSVSCPAKNIVYEIAESSGTVARHPGLKRKEGGE